MVKKLWRMFFGKPNLPDDELSGFTKLLLEVRFIGYLCIVFFGVIQPFVIASYETPTCSMEPTIMTNTRYFALPSIFGGFVQFTKIKLPGYKKIEHGDIVIFKYPLDEKQSYVKRVIGLPGDRVEIIDRVVYINQTAIKEPYARFLKHSIVPSTNYGPVVVPSDHLFVLGDNRDLSYDSRFWGFVPVENVYGTPLITFWSYDLQKHQIRFKELFKRLK